MTHPPKAQVRRAFEKAAPSYDSAARVQRRVCGQLALGLPAMMTPGVILDAGCGTGFALHLLRERFPPADLVGLDISPAMVAHIEVPAIHRLAGDVEHLPLADECIGLYWSSLTLQWCNLPRALVEARRVLWRGGHLAVATLGPQTFHELRTAFAAADSHRHTLDFLSPDAVAAAAAGFRNPRLERQRETVCYPDLKSLLRAIKAIGANQVGEQRRNGLMSRGAWQRLETAYEAQRLPTGLPLTYDVITLHAQK
ncbi:MAG: malonyl-ACP O-methyltransferase BioC [Betaproteobacteria bacterium]|nr:malonyl-ACP O-methyltransferase BioC [Betaproteobacteria bacterium]